MGPELINNLASHVPAGQVSYLMENHWKKKKKKTKPGVRLAEDPNEQDRRPVTTGKDSGVNTLLRSSYGRPTG